MKKIKSQSTQITFLS